MEISSRRHSFALSVPWRPQTSSSKKIQETREFVDGHTGTRTGFYFFIRKLPRDSEAAELMARFQPGSPGRYSGVSLDGAQDQKLAVSTTTSTPSGGHFAAKMNIPALPYVSAMANVVMFDAIGPAEQDG